MTGHDTHLTTLGDNTRTVTADHSGLGLGSKRLLDHELVPLGNTLGNGHNQGDFGLDGFQDGTGGAGGRDVDDTGVGLGVSNGLCDECRDQQGRCAFFRLGVLTSRTEAQTGKPRCSVPAFYRQGQVV